MNAIKKAMRDNEREVMKMCRRNGRVGENVFMATPWRNAIKRLEAKGKLRYSKYEMAYVTTQQEK